MSFYIYKYVDKGNIIYVGQTTDLQKRIKQHTKDKLKGFQGEIYYFECPNKTAMDSWEYCLINKYHPPYNIALKNTDINIDIKEPKWEKYMETSNNSNIINFSDYINSKKVFNTPTRKDDNAVIISGKPKVQFTCKHCRTTFETSNWTLTKSRHHSAKCPCCPYTAWAK